eukprot:jgi/Tetstr1/454858/TSEL_041723.t1
MGARRREGVARVVVRLRLLYGTKLALEEGRARPGQEPLWDAIFDYLCNMHDHDFRQQADTTFGPEGVFLHHAVMCQLELFDAHVAPHFHDNPQEELNPFARRNVSALWIEPSVGPGLAGGGGLGSGAGGSGESGGPIQTPRKPCFLCGSDQHNARKHPANVPITRPYMRIRCGGKHARASRLKTKCVSPPMPGYPRASPIQG